MRIGLFGFTLSHENMGCQALTCSFLELIRKYFIKENVEIVVFRNENDMGIIPELFPSMQFSLFRISFKNRNPYFMTEVKKCDIIFDETFGDGFSDIYFVKSVYRDTFAKYLVGRSKVPFIMTPQTYGPFKHKTLQWLAGRAIKKADVVYARDKISADYASIISKRKVKVVTDLALGLPFKKSLLPSDKKRLGINISGLLWQGGFNKKNQFGLITEYKQYSRKIIEYGLYSGYEVHIIPHVTRTTDPTRSIPDGDYEVCKELAIEYPETFISPCFESPYEAKNYIASMDYFIGARMHATIGAFSAGVITIPFAYSRKFKGLYDNLEYPYYVDGTKLSTEDSINNTVKYIENYERLKAANIKAMGKVREDLDLFEKELQKILNEIMRKYNITD